jgi:hypothetical protein
LLAQVDPPVCPQGAHGERLVVLDRICGGQPVEQRGKARRVDRQNVWMLDRGAPHLGWVHRHHSTGW